MVIEQQLDDDEEDERDKKLLMIKQNQEQDLNNIRPTTSASSSSAMSITGSSYDLLAGDIDAGSNNQQNLELELCDENVRLRKKYDQLRSECMELEMRYESVWSEKIAMARLAADQSEQLCQLRKTLNASVDLNEYERLRAELDQTAERARTLSVAGNLLRKELEQRDAAMARMQLAIDELREENQQLRQQIRTIGQNRDMTAKLLCDIELMQAKMNEFMTTIAELTDENQELRNLVEQYQHEYQRQNLGGGGNNLFCYSQSLMSVQSSQPASNHHHGGNGGGEPVTPTNTITAPTTPIHQTRSFSNLLAPPSAVARSTAETMADIKISDLEQQIVQLQCQLSTMAVQNDQLRRREMAIPPPPPPPEMVDRPVQTEEPPPPPPPQPSSHHQPTPSSQVIAFTSETTATTKKIYRWPLVEHHHKISRVTPKPKMIKRKRRRRFLCLF